MKRITILIIVGLFLLQMACQTLTAPRHTPTPYPAVLASPQVTVTASPPTPTPVPFPTPLDIAGPACFGSFGYGVTCLQDNEWINYTRENSSLSGDQIVDMTVCPGGEILVLHTQGTDLFDGVLWRHYGQGWGYGSPAAIACAASNDFWVAHFQGVTHFDGQSWKTYPVKETLTHDPEAHGQLKDIAVAPDGAIWAVTNNSLAVFTNGEWQVYEKGAGFSERYFFENIAFDAQGHPRVTSSRGLFTYDGPFWNLYTYQDLTSPQGLTVDKQNRVWAGTFNSGLLVFENGSWLKYTAQNSALASENVRVLTTDTQGRVWVGTTWGLYVVEGKNWTSYHISNSDLADDAITAIAVVGRGPTLPPAQHKAPGALTGKLIAADGAPLANVPIEVCVETLYSSYLGVTPCEGHSYVRDAVSGADGAFTIEKLPTGFYNLAIQNGETWMLYSSRSRGSSERFLVPSGETKDLGEIIVGGE
ncbi:MAG TPA: two-component regulator propeller domain-containing protein [Anaerolineae bacterium]|nr:two-component regulator propeller domain-containing protein [Anaerolineae bacterium]HQK14595.1 two-component regulator propeller domain-containing protein [Anaerolineae bacterium]